MKVTVHLYGSLSGLEDCRERVLKLEPNASVSGFLREMGFSSAQSIMVFADEHIAMPNERMKEGCACNELDGCFLSLSRQTGRFVKP